MRRRIGWGSVAWLGILIAIGAVQVVRAQWFDAALFLGCAAVLAIDALRPARREAPAHPAGRWLVVLVAGAALAAAFVPRQSIAMAVLLCLIGAAAILFAWPQTGAKRAPWPPALRRLAVAWSIILVVGCVWELAQFIAGRVSPSGSAFALSELLDPLLGTPVGTIAFVVLWAAGGLFLMRRGRQ